MTLFAFVVSNKVQSNLMPISVQLEELSAQAYSVT